MKKIKHLYLFILITFVITISNLHASISIRDLIHKKEVQEQQLVDEDKLIQQMEKEADQERAKENKLKKEKKTSKQSSKTKSKKIQQVQQSPEQAPTKIDLTFFILTLIGLVIVEIIIIFTDYIKPKYFDDLY